MTPVQRFARVLRAPDVARLLGAAVLARMPDRHRQPRHRPLRARRDGLVRARRPGGGRLRPRRRLSRPRSSGRLIDRHGARAGHAAAGGPPRRRAGRARRPRAGGRADGRAGGLRLGGRHHHPAGGLGRPAAAGAACWPTTPSLLPTAYALDGIAIELVFVTGPLLTAAIVVVASPAVALLVACGFVLVGTVVLVAVAGLARLAAGRRATHERHLLGALRLARACAPSSPRRPPSASPWAPPR